MKFSELYRNRKIKNFGAIKIEQLNLPKLIKEYAAINSDFDCLDFAVSINKLDPDFKIYGYSFNTPSFYHFWVGRTLGNKTIFESYDARTKEYRTFEGDDPFYREAKLVETGRPIEYNDTSKIISINIKSFKNAFGFYDYINKTINHNIKDMI